VPAASSASSPLQDTQGTDAPSCRGAAACRTKHLPLFCRVVGLCQLLGACPEKPRCSCCTGNCCTTVQHPTWEQACIRSFDVCVKISNMQHAHTCVLERQHAASNICFCFCVPSQVLSPEYASRAAALAAAAAAREQDTAIDLQQQPTTPGASSRQSEVGRLEGAQQQTQYPQLKFARELHGLCFMRQWLELFHERCDVRPAACTLHIVIRT
jgi:hypothetical protein